MFKANSFKSKSAMLAAAAFAGFSATLVHAAPTVTVINDGAAHDSFGDTVPGYTGYTLVIAPDANSNIAALDFGDSVNSASYGLYGTFIQDSTPTVGRSGTTYASTPYETYQNGGSAIDSHFLLNPLVPLTPQAEDNNVTNNYSSTNPNDASDSFGTGTYLIGDFSITPTTSAVNAVYVVVPNTGTPATYKLLVGENAVAAGGVTGTPQVSGTIGTAATTTTTTTTTATVNKIISLTSTAPTSYGSQLGHSISISGQGGSYTVGNTGQVADPGQTTAFTLVGTFNPATDSEVYALKLDKSGVAIATTNTTLIAAIVADINASNSGNVVASTVTGSYAQVFPGYDVLLTAAVGPGATPYLGVDFSGDTADPGVTVTEIAAVPEPATAAGVVLGAAGLLLGRRKSRVTTA